MKGFCSVRGVTLVELMISMALGLLISAAAIQQYITHQRTLNVQRALSLVHEQGRYGQALLTAQMKLSGYGGKAGVVNSFVFSSASDAEQYDVLEIQIAGAGTDCMGGPLNEESQIKRKKFYVKEGVLLCADSDGIRAPIIQGVELFQVVYGLDQDRSPMMDEGYGSANMYVDGSRLSDVDYSSVVSVKIALVIKSQEKISYVQADREERNVWVLNQTIADDFTSSPDGYLRRLFSSTTAVRNFSRG